MAFRILPSGVIETDSVSEALEVQAAIAKKPALRNRVASAAGTTRSDLLNPKAKLFLRALVAAYPDGLTTEKAAKIVEVDPKGIPPVIRSINSYCRKHRMTLADLIGRETAYENRRAVSLYKFTEEGHSKFSAVLKNQPPNGADSGGETEEKTTA